MKKIIILSLLVIFCKIGFCQTSVSGPYFSNTRWNLTNSPYIIVGDVQIPTGVTLSIEPGVQIKYNGNYQILIKGSISANGTSFYPITFTGAKSGRTMIMFKSTDLSLSTLSHLRFTGPKFALQLAEEKDGIEDQIKNIGVLTVSNINFNSTGVKTYGFKTSAALIINNANAINTTFDGYNPTITINKSSLDKCLIYSESDIDGITLNNSIINNSAFNMGCCGSNVNLFSSTVVGSSFNNNNEGLVSIRSSLIVNSSMSLRFSYIEIFNSSILSSAGLNLAHVVINSSTISGNRKGDILNINEAGIGGGSITNSTIENGINGVIINTTITLSGNNFINLSGYNVKNNTTRDVVAKNNWWGSSDPAVIATKIYDYYDDINYGIVDFSNYKYPITITAFNATKVYGEPNPVFTGTVAGLINGDNPDIIYILKGKNIIPSVSGSALTNYILTTVSGTLTITPAPLTVTALNIVKVYGQSDPVFIGTIAGLSNGDNLDIRYLLNGSIIIPSVSGFALTNYILTTVSGTLTITPAPLTVTAFNAAKVYRGADPVFTGTIVGLVNGEQIDVYYFLEGSSIIPSVSGSALTNYILTTISGTLTIIPSPLTVTAFNAAKVYGEPDPIFAGTIVGLLNNDYVNVSYIASGNNIIPIVTGAALVNYSLTTLAGILIINPVPLSVKADNATKIYGQPNPSFTSSVVGLVNGDEVNVSYLIDGNTIIPSVTGSVLINYILTVIPGTLTITPAPLTVTAFNVTKVYGQSDPVFTGTIAGLANGDNLAITYLLNGSLIIPSVSGSVLANYILITVSGTLTITPASLTVTAFNATKVYGAPDPVFTGTIVGLVNDEQVDVYYFLDGSSIIASVTGAALVNYNLTTIAGTLTITPASQTISGFNAIPTLTVGGVNYIISGVTASSGLPVTFSSSNANVVSVVGNVLIPVSAGDAIIIATQAGNSDYASVSSALGVNVTSITTRVAVEMMDISFNIFPNPNRGSFFIENRSRKVIPVQLLNAVGSVVAHLTLQENLNEISLSLPEGIYLLKSAYTATKIVIE